MKKYEFTGETKLFVGRTLRQIRALTQIKCGAYAVTPGTVGGWIENEENLSHDGNAWVYGDAQVYGNAQVYVELVDCVIRIFDYLGNEGADVEAIMAEKCAYNETRPYRHGKKF